ncbi:MAG: hypothetical protein K2I18_01045 [Paramuribaculum sp.]|nr:hypothetical protein [Paramuribaculum sp.]
MNFTLTPGVYAALNLLSKATRNKVLEAAFAFVICGIRPTNLSKNLLVMFMMVVDSASEGTLTYTPDGPAEEKPAEPISEEQELPQNGQHPESQSAKAPEEVQPSERNYHFHLTGGNRIVRNSEDAPAAKKLRRRKRNRK